MKTYTFKYSLGKKVGTIDVNTKTLDIADKVADLLIQDLVGRTRFTKTLTSTTNWK